MNHPALWKNGEHVSREAAGVDVLAHALHYGTGVFEGIRCYDTGRGPAIFELAAHMRRFERGAQTLGMDIDIDELTNAIIETVARSGFNNAYIRPLAFYASGGLGLDTAPLSAEVAVGVMPWTSHLGEAAENKGIGMHVSSYRRNSHKSLPPLKLCGGYVNSILAKREASLAGYDEALFVDDDDWVCEATGENVFMVNNGRVTAVEHCDALPGITRSVVMQLTAAIARPVSLKELLSADEVFLTGTSAEVVPVSNINGHHYGSTPVTRELQHTYANLVRGRESASQGQVAMP